MLISEWASLELERVNGVRLCRLDRVSNWNGKASMEFDIVDLTGRIVDCRMMMTGDEEGVKTEVINLP